MLERIGRIEQAGRVEDDHLYVVVCSNTHDSIARGLRLGADDAQFLTDDAIQKRGLSRVRFAGDGDDSRSCHWPKIMQSNGLPSTTCRREPVK